MDYMTHGTSKHQEDIHKSHLGFSGQAWSQSPMPEFWHLNICMLFLGLLLYHLFEK